MPAEEKTRYTRTLCSYIKNTNYDDIPPAVIERAKMMVIQTIGSALAARPLKQCEDVLSMAKEMSSGSGQENATLWGDGRKVSAEAALLAAGAMSDMLDWEDCALTGHPSSGVIPTAVIASEMLGKSGKELLTAVVIGYEVYMRVALSGRSNLVAFNIFGCLPVLMKLMDMSEEEMNRCFGIGAACAIIPCNVHECTMSDSLNYHYGFRAENCLTMAKTAMIPGVTGLEDCFDHPDMYLNHMAKESQEPQWLTKELGERFLMMDILIKHWPTNMFVQTYTELAYRLRTKYDVDPAQVEEIICKPSIAFRHWSTDSGYHSLTQAQFSIPFGVASAFLHPEEPGAVWYQPETMRSRELIDLMNKVHADGFVDMNKGRTGYVPILKELVEGWHPEKFMTVRLKDGREYTESAFTHPGHPNYMLSRDEFKDRFRTETRGVLSGDKTEKLLNVICHLDQYGSVDELTACLHEGKKGIKYAV